MNLMLYGMLGFFLLGVIITIIQGLHIQHDLLFRAPRSQGWIVLAHLDTGWQLVNPRTDLRSARQLAKDYAVTHKVAVKVERITDPS